jgi:hypothetical protein
MNKNNIISEIYYDPAGFGSIKQTYLEAKAKDPTIKYDDAKNWIHHQVEQKKQLNGYNSFIANEPREEYQIDLFFIPKKEFPNEVYVGGVLAIDVFTRYISIIPIQSKTIPEILQALKTIMNKMGPPKKVYSDNEGAWSVGTEIDKYFKEQHIQHLITLSHPAFSERAIRTIKNEIYKRVKLPSDKNWTDFLYPILLKYNYKSVHSATGFTPAEAEKKQNHWNVKLTMEMHKKKTRIYPDIQLGEYVRIHKNKNSFDKEHISTWSDKRYKVNRITETFGQQLYYLDGYHQNGRSVGLLRHDILLTV